MAVKRIVTVISCAAIACGNLAAGASASPPATSPASCVGIITSAEASQLPPGSVGEEVSGLAQSVPRLGQALVSPLARTHLESIGQCAAG
jgi:hypothetical protein